MARREVFMVESADRAVAFRQNRIAAQAQAPSIAAFLEQINLAIALYSRGDALDDVRAAVRAGVVILENDPSAVKAKFNFTNHDEYFGALWGLSLSILFGDPSTEFLIRGAAQDAIFDHLIRLTGALIAPTATQIRPNSQYLLSAIVDPQNAMDAIKTYLLHWYPSMAQTTWHDTHLQQDPAFFGYWSFELAAVVKALSISDTGFSDNIFYPRDLVHQRLFRTWLDGQAGDQERQVHDAATAQARMLEARQALLSFFEGTHLLNADTAKSVTDSLKMMSGLLGLRADLLQEKPELLRVGLMQLIGSITAISKEALSATEGSSDPKKQEVLDAFKTLQEKFGGADSDMATASKLFAEYVAIDESQLGDETSRVAAAKTRLETVNTAFSALVADKSIGLEGLFDGLDRLFKDFGDQLGIAPQKPYDVYARSSQDVGEALDKANKKNMIGEDFDWSSIWKS